MGVVQLSVRVVWLCCGLAMAYEEDYIVVMGQEAPSTANNHSHEHSQHTIPSYNTPFVLGNSIFPISLHLAILIALASALKIASIL